MDPHWLRRVLLVDDDPLMTRLLCDVLEQKGFEVAAASSAAEARDVLGEFDPDIALVDLELGGGPSGVDMAHLIHHQHPGVVIIILTRYPDLATAGFANATLPPGTGFVRKDLVHDPSYLVEAIEQVLRDQPRDVRHDTDPTRPLGDLTEHQLEILRLLALGYTNDAIARRKDAGRSTVERWIAGILKAMGIDSGGEVNPRVEAVRRYVAVAGIPERP
jgi:DNA-binding NarL/FixJ family response regulator